MLSSAKIGRSSWRYYQRTVAGGACEYYAEHGEDAVAPDADGAGEIIAEAVVEADVPEADAAE